MQLTVGDIIRQAARAAPERVAAWLDGAEPITFKGLDRAANRLGHALRARGVSAGDRIVWWGDGILEPLPLFAAAAKLGAVFAPLNARLGAAEARPLVEKIRPRLLVIDGERAEAARDFGVEVARFGGAGPGIDLTAAESASDSDVVEPRLRETDPHVIFFTSGSTGGAKGVVLSHRASALRAFGGTATRGGGTVCMFPLYHMAGWSIALGCWQMREEVAFVRQADAPSLLSAVARRRSRRLYAIPAVWARLLDASREEWDLSSLREADTGTSATPLELLAEIRATWPQTTTRVFYGSTEAGPGTQLAHDDVLRKPGSVGVASPGVAVRLTSAGEVCIRSNFLMDGYFKDADATATALIDGWYHTGDLGAFDDEGYLSIVGRLRDVIRTGGESVSPREVEAVLGDVPGVGEVAVIGLPDPEWGEVVCAVIVRQAGREVDLDMLRAACDGRLAAFKRPRRLEVVDALPRTPATGQVQRALLVETIGTARNRRAP